MQRNCWVASLAKRISLFLGLLAFLAFCSIQPLYASAYANVPPTLPPAYVRLIQASPDVGTADVFVDGSKFLSSFAFATVTDYKQLPAGSHKVQLALIGKGPDAAVITYTLAVQAGLAYTVAAIGTKATGLALEFIIDDNHLTSDRAKLRVYHLAPGRGAVSVASGGKTLLSGLAYPNASDYLTLPAGSYTFYVTAPQLTTTNAVSAGLEPNTVTSLFVLGIDSQNPQLQVISAQVKGVPALSGTGSDPSARLAPSQPFPLLAPWIMEVLALAGMSAGLVASCLLGARGQKRVYVPNEFALYRKYGLCRHGSKREEQLHRMTRGQGVGSKNIFPGRALWLVVAALALMAALVLPGCGQQPPSSHKAPPIHSSTVHSSTAHLLIPTIGVTAAIEPIGVLPDGTLAIPTQDPWNDVGWYNGGPHPGEQGSAVINGHLDHPGGSPAVFWHLNELHIGDKVIVVDAQGKTLHFHVIRIMFYGPQAAPVQDIFGNMGGRFLNLMTCAGGWIASEHQTSLRLVVYTSSD